MAENLKYLSTVPSQTESKPVTDDAAVGLPADPYMGAETYAVPANGRAEAYGSVQSPFRDSSKTVAMGALILSLALLLVLAGLVVRRRLRSGVPAEPDLVELDKRELSALRQDSNQAPEAGSGDDTAVEPRSKVSPIVSFDEQDPRAEEVESGNRESDDGSPDRPQGPKKTISVKAPPKPKRRF